MPVGLVPRHSFSRGGSPKGSSIEIRKYLDVAQSSTGENVYLVDKEGEQKYEATGKMEFVFFLDFILDCINRTEVAMTQEHVLLSMALALEAEDQARII